tara:strand:+ start:361 stop:798 length:438 start_codon:yes stop_codon:yes gene_type:complete
MAAKRTKAQKAATAKLVKFNKQKAKGKKSNGKPKTKTRTKIVTKIKTVVKRKTNKGGKKSPGVKTSLKSITGSKTLQKVALGVGGGIIATALVNRFMPSSGISKFAAPIAAISLGGIEGLIGQFALNMFSTPGGNSNVQPQMEAL